jgi:hypothetical protein
MQEANDCAPFFRQRQGNDGVRNYIFLTKESLEGQTSLRFLSHELTHALLAAKAVHTPRVIAEFFAVYVENIVADDAFTYDCQSANWNQPALATSNGDYVSALHHLHQNKSALRHVVACRYGQLAHVTQQLHKKYPTALLHLWKRLGQHKEERVGLTVFHQWVREVGEAARFIGRYHILQNTDFEPHILIVPFKKEGYAIVVFRIVDGHQELYVFEGKVGVIIASEENNIFSFRRYDIPISNGLASIGGSYLKSGDVITVEIYFADEIVSTTLRIP